MGNYYQLKYGVNGEGDPGYESDFQKMANIAMWMIVGGFFVLVIVLTYVKVFQNLGLW